jgi:AsmA-like C-terminal region
LTRTRTALAGAGLAIVVAIAAIGVVGARMASILEAHRVDLLTAVAKFVGWPVEAESLDASWFPPAVVARRVRVPDVSPYGPGDLVSADEARFEFALLPLLGGRLVVSEVRLQAPVLRVVRGAEGGWNLTPPVGSQEAEPHRRLVDGFAPDVVVDTVRVRNARVLYRDRAIPGLGEVELKALNLRLHHGEGVVVDWNGQVLGGPEENLSGRLTIPPPGAEGQTAHLEFDAVDIDASRLPEVIGVLRGRLPFALGIGGVAEAHGTGEFPATWPPTSAAIELTVDAAEASVRAAGGWIEKAAGSPLGVEAALVASGDALLVRRLVLRSGESELRAEAQGPIEGSAQPPLEVASHGLGARTFAQWVPLLAVLEPTGALALSGRIAPAGGPFDVELRLTGDSLDMAGDGGPIRAARLGLQLLLSDDHKGILGSLRLDDVRSSEAAAATIELAVGGDFAAPINAKLVLTGGSVRGAPVERIAVEVVVSRDGADVRMARADAFGGLLRMAGRVERRRDLSYAATLEPEWNGIDLRGLLLAAGAPAQASGTLRGRAQLRTAFGDLDAALANLEGTIDVALVDGDIADLNVAAATLANLRGVPKLRDAVERRARERLPELLEAHSHVALVSVQGEIADRAAAVSRLILESRLYSFEAAGKVGFDGATDLAGTLTLSSDATQALVSESPVAQLLVSPGGRVRIPVTVRGDYPGVASAPTSEFLSRLMARAIAAPADEGGGWLGRFLGGRTARTGGERSDAK